ncbi:NAD(P)H-hydrate dehydratase [Oricola sp.]|uniref:NAD(P)H-hydrate dehydratase n=1 Tax=Oricola sp. TaxID=1979950 RepID=UPI0025DA96BC|nr:NAD(P)H-hydrate dehydratase [Oricola sp.]MCI5075947.1 NAD(P)H-hydrate dehydratase [Oricola sp.]
MKQRGVSKFGDALLTCAAMGRADAWTIDNGCATGIELMESAGAAVMTEVLQRFGDAKRVAVLCGPGNNGGDGYVAARLLRERGVQTVIHSFGPPREGSDAAIAASRWTGPVSLPDSFAPETNDLVIDAVFGAGLTRSLPEEVRAAFDRARQTGCRIVAIDLPSGVNGDSGVDLGGALAADVTVTFFRKKPGHLLFPGRALCGGLVVADIGVSAGVFRDEQPLLFENGPSLWRGALPKPGTNWHKYARGHAAVFSGGRHATGASRLSAMAAQRAGAGAVTILGPADALDAHAAHVTSIMLKPCAPDDAYDRLIELKGCRACVLGPGFGDLPAARRIAVPILEERAETGLRLVLDADGISAFATDPRLLFDAARASGEVALVLTPHEGEFARLFPDIRESGGMSKLDKARAAAERAHAVVIYKGPDTVVAAPDGRAAINSNATPALATAGSGDVVAGIAAGLLAQGVPPFEAAAAAVWLHGEAGRAAGPLAIAEDLIGEVGPALARLLD